MKILNLFRFIPAVLILQIPITQSSPLLTDIKESVCCFDLNPAPFWEEFETNVHKALEDVGYVIQIQKNGKTLFSKSSGYARTPNDGNIAWDPDVPMHTASVSKLITAIGLKRLLQAKGISIDSPIIDYLPGSWAKGPNIDDITFRHLMTHRSGFKGVGSTTDYYRMKKAISDGVIETGKPDYENVNFSLVRILSFYLLYGKHYTQAIWPDDYTDKITTQRYLSFMQSYIFHPAGVNGATTISNSTHALAYPIAVASQRWNDQSWTPKFSDGVDQGNQSYTIGGLGWTLSANDLLRLMHSFRSGVLMTPADAQELLDDGLGIDGEGLFNGEKYYHKNGAWGVTKQVQALIYLLPNNVEIAVYVNSPLPGNAFFRSIMTKIIKKYLTAVPNI